MLLTLSTTHRPATDLGFLLGKHPDRLQTFELSVGKAHVFYTDVTDELCTAALLLDLDPLDLVRSARRDKSARGMLKQYVNDRPYASTSFMSVAIGKVFRSALSGVSKERPELADSPIELQATLVALPVRGGEAFLRELFEPLGYELGFEREVLDEHFASWGPSPYYKVTLRGRVRLSELLSHLYVLIPVLDDSKHYWVGEDEVDKLLNKGGEWLRAHPLRERITNRYLKRQRSLTREALARLTADDDPDPDASEQTEARHEEQLEKPLSLNQQRIGAVLAVLRESKAKRVIDVGCGEGKLLRALLKEQSFEHVVGMDVSMHALEKAKQRLHLDRLPPRQQERVGLFQGSLTYRDDRLAGFDAACVIEVIEHIDPSRLDAFEQVLFDTARPETIVVTTPNVEHNVRFEGLEAGRRRHRDHRFEWTRAEFRAWAAQAGERWDYMVRFLAIGTDDAEVGPPTQMAVFTRSSP